MQPEYEGKAKQIVATDDPSVVIQRFKDSATAFNGKKYAEFDGKGQLNCAISCFLFNKLEEAGLVTRRRDTEDRRRIWVSLTDTGRSVLESSPDPLQNRFRNGFERLEDWEQAMLVTALERVAALLDAGDLDAAPILEIGDLDSLLKDQL